MWLDSEQLHNTLIATWKIEQNTKQREHFKRQRSHTSLSRPGRNVALLRVAFKMIILKSQVELLFCASSEKKLKNANTAEEEAHGKMCLQSLVFICRAVRFFFFFPQPDEQVTVAVV